MLFTIPFNEVTKSSGSTTHKWYDYSLRYSTTIVTNTETITISGSSLNPPRNFYRLNTLNINKKFSDLDLDTATIANISCSGTNFRYCYDETPSKPYSCNTGYYLDPKTSTCNQSCPNGFMRYPGDNPNNNNDYCLFPCYNNSLVCPNSSINYKSISYFTCATGFINAYFRCYGDSSSYVDTALQFSKSLNTQPFEINLGTNYNSFVIDVWIYPDMKYNNPSNGDYIFLTNNHHVLYGDGSTSQSQFVAGSTSFDFQSGDTLNLSTWSHLVIFGDAITVGGSTNVYYFSFQQNVHRPNAITVPNTLNSASGSYPLTKIYFCQNGDTSVSSKCNKDWINAYYKKLRIWDATYTNIRAVTYYPHYAMDNYNNIFNLKHYFPMDLSNITFNKIQDVKNPSIYGTFPINSAAKVTNPDNHNMFNYVNNYSYEDLNPGKVVTSSSLTTGNTLVSINIGTCNASCSKCFKSASGKCFECADGYGLFDSQCLQNNSTPQYYYKHPPSNLSNSSSVSLKLTSLNLSSYPGMTMFFFIKLYGFTVSSSLYKLIIFESNLKYFLAFNPTAFDGSLELYYDNRLQFQYQGFRNLKFGTWVPISISAYRETNVNIFPNMIHMTIDYTQMPILDSAMSNYVVSEFTMPSTWIGLISDITFYNSFIISAWGFKKFDSDYQNNSKYIISTFPMKSNISGQCLADSQLSSGTVSGLGVICVADYNPHWVTSTCGANIQNVYLDEDEVSKCVSCNCSSSTTTASPAGGRCLNNGGVCACEHKDPTWRASLPHWTNNSKAIGPANTNSLITCGSNYGLDFGRFNYGVIPNVYSPTTTFNMDFWFYSQSYVNVNFSSLTITWDRHIKVVISYNGSNFIGKCYPVIDVNTPANDPTPITITLGSINRNWTYINCGVNHTANNFYFIKGVTVPAATSYTTVNTIPSSGYVTLTINESSPNGYGVTYLRQLRLWNCYSCSTAYRNINYSSTDPNFENVVNAWNCDVSNGNMTDQANSPAIANLQMTERSNFVGYNVVFSVGNPVTCDEPTHRFYNQGTGSCDRLLNFNRVQDQVYSSVPSSRTSRYTIEVWIWIEKVDQFAYGMNFIYDRHVGLSILMNQTTNSALSSVCFPQEYRDDLNGRKGPDVFNLYNTAINKTQDTSSNASSTWCFFRCAVDLSRNRVFYLNQNPNVSIVSETLYGSTQNIKPFRFFDMPQYTNIYVQNMTLNKTRIFLKYLTVYREFMAASLYDLRWKDMKLYATNAFWPLVFTADYEEYVSSPWVDIGRYRYNDPENGTSGILYQTKLLTSLTTVRYASSPDYNLLTLCNAIQKSNGSITAGTCTTISGTCDTTANFCLDSGPKYFYSSGKYIDTTALTVANSCTGSTRLPDDNGSDGYCLFTCPSGNNNACGSSASNISVANYYNSFTCNTGYTKVYYECIDSTLIPYSAIYFNQFYSWSNIIKDFSASPKTNYYLEFWFLMDNINGPGSVSVKNFYLLAPPHYIFKDPNDQMFKYANFKISSGNVYYTLASISTYEWNKIIILTQLDSSTNKYNIYVYVNYNFLNPDVTITGLSSSVFDMSLQGIAFCNKPQATCAINSVTYTPTWGTAWYRNIRIWDDSISSVYSIQSFENSFSEYTKGLYYYYPMTIDMIAGNKVSEKINNSSNAMNVVFWFYGQNYDNDSRLNYSVNYDYGQLNTGSYITSVNASKNYITTSCNSACKRCYSSAQNNCYECNLGYTLYGKTCQNSSGYFLKTPTGNATTKVTINTNITNPTTFNIATQNPMTITLFFKFMGLQSSAAAATYHPIVYFRSTTTYLGYDPTDKKIVLVIGGTLAYSVPTPINQFIGVWTHVGLSVYRSGDTTLMTHMFNFMYHNSLIIPQAGFSPTTTAVNFDRVEFDTKIIALFSSLRFYSNFFIGTYGHVTALSSTQSLDLIYEVRLYGSSSNNCVADSELGGSQTGASISLQCVGDYHPYMDNSLQCSNDNKYLDFSLVNSPPCGNCDQSCSTRCFSSSSTSCSCTFNSMKYWVATQSLTSNYSCQAINSINFAFYNSITIPNISTTVNDEMTIEFWLYIYSFVPGKFSSIDISWDKHNRVQIISSASNTINVNCYPFVDMSSFNSYTFKYTSGINEKGWYYIRCSVNTYTRKFYVNNAQEMAYSPDPPPFVMPSSTSLTIVDNSTSLNYGFSFIRELKLYSAYLYRLWDPSRIILKSSSFAYLLHYFRNTYSGGDAILVDQVKLTNTVLTRKNNLIGYNYVQNFIELYTCDEGYMWDPSTASCKAYNSQFCKLSSDINYNCVSCLDSRKFLLSNSTCTSDCGIGYFGDTYLNQCRTCDSSCLTCNGKRSNNCLSCTGSLYLIPNLSICTPDCEKYKLTKSLATPNLCVSFEAQAEITNLNIDYAIKPSTLNLIEARVFNSTGGNYTVNWRFGDTDTQKINSNITSSMYFDPRGPFTSVTNSLSVNVNPKFFTEKYKYVFYLDINNISIYGSSTTVTVKFILTMNDYPQNGKLTAQPIEGYANKTNFVITCNNWIDDNTATPDLKYLFTYFDHKGTETLIHDYSYDQEVNVILPLPTTYQSSNIIIRCYSQDLLGAVNKTETSVLLYSNPSMSYKNIPILESLNSTDLNSSTLSDSQLNIRSELIESFASDFYKSYIINRTEVKKSQFFNDFNLTLLDPICNTNNIFTDYCNNRGSCYLIDKYLACNCVNYTGTNCQIDNSSYDSLKYQYDSLYTKIIQSLTTDTQGIVINSLENLMSGASYFLTEPSYLLQIYDFINLSINRYPNYLFNNFKNYFEIFNYQIDWGIYKMNQYKLQNQIKLYGAINSTSIRNASMSTAQSSVMTTYFTTLKSNFDSLLEFYAKNLKNITSLIKYKTKNFDVYIVKLDNTFDFSNFFQDEIKSYQSYFDCKECIDFNMKTKYRKSNYTLVMTYVNWKTSPFITVDNLYKNNSSPLIGLNFYDWQSGVKYPIFDCDNSTIKFYFPMTNQWLADFINEKREILDPSKQFYIPSAMFNDPMYIEASGKVLNYTIDERYNKYFVPYNFTCDFFNPAVSSFDSSGCNYKNFTELNFFKCECKHLTEFMVNYFQIIPDLRINTRFFYLWHYNLFFYPDNYTYNIAFYILLAIFGLYVSIIFFYSFCDCYIFRKLNIIDYLKAQIVKINLPYKRNYLYNLDMIMSEADLDRIRHGAVHYQQQEKKLRERQKLSLPEDKGLRLNDVDVLVLGENIGGDHDDPIIFLPRNVVNHDDKKHKKFFKNLAEEKTKQHESNLNYFKEDLDGKLGKKAKENEKIKSPLDGSENDKSEKSAGKFTNSKLISDENGGKLPPILNLDDFSQELNIFNDKDIGEGIIPPADTEKEVVNFDKHLNNFLNDEIDREPEIIVKKNIREGLESLEEEHLDELPRLAKSYGLEVRLVEFYGINLSFCEFLRRNLSNRHILMVSIFRLSIIYGSFKRIGILICTLSMMMICLTILLTIDETILYVRIYFDLSYIYFLTS
jgi:hypothetical protein